MQKLNYLRLFKYKAYTILKFTRFGDIELRFDVIH